MRKLTYVVEAHSPEPLALPTVHLNGTSRAALAAQLEACHQALEAAGEALTEAGPNARDYYPQGPEAFGRAEQQHSRRMRLLRNLQLEIVALWEGVTER